MATNNPKIYSDLDLRFIAQPGNKDVAMSYNEQSVIRSIKNLLLSKPYERLFQPDLSSQVDNILFEPITSLTGNLLKNEIMRVISNWEPRARIASIDVVAVPEQSGYTVSLFFYVGNKVEPTAINLILKRSR